MTEEFTKTAKVEELIVAPVGIVGEQLVVLEKTKEPIKKTMALTAAKRERIRMIESTSTRQVHFLFMTKQKSIITPFSRKYLRVISGNL